MKFNNALQYAKAVAIANGLPIAVNRQLRGDVWFIMSGQTVLIPDVQVLPSGEVKAGTMIGRKALRGVAA